MEFNAEKFNEIKHAAEDAYNKIGTVHCPYLNEKVHFNVKGLDHLIFKGFNRTRPVQDQYARFRHLHLAPEIIKNSKTLQGYDCRQKMERIRRNGKRETVMSLVTYYEFIAVMESHGSKVRVKIVVKQVAGAEKHFLSIIPSWGIHKLTGEKVIISGNPEVD